MTDLDKLARQYHAYINSDGRGFRRKARILQSIWREEKGYEPGTHKGPLGSCLTMPFAKNPESLPNYLTENIRDVVRTEVLDLEKSKGKLFAKPRIFNDLLSSQPLCFNLFGELQLDLPLSNSNGLRLRQIPNTQMIKLPLMFTSGGKRQLVVRPLPGLKLSITKTLRAK